MGRPAGPKKIIVQDRRRDDAYRVEDGSLAKLTEPLRDVPQSIVTIPRELLEDRGATSLNDALRTVPGITLGAGEFSWQGNNPNIRGFSSRNDMFIDGMRDFGSYPRDPFNVETIEVLQGPSSMIFGRGSTGGVINQVTKRPDLDALTRLSFNGGGDATRRATADVVRPLAALGPAAPMPVNAMAHQAEVADRKGAASERYGIAPSLALGLDGPTRLTLSYCINRPTTRRTTGCPARGQARAGHAAEFLRLRVDYLQTGADIPSADVTHAASERLSLHGHVRDARYTRESRLTEPLIAIRGNSSTAGTSTARSGNSSAPHTACGPVSRRPCFRRRLRITTAVSSSSRTRWRAPHSLAGGRAVPSGGRTLARALSGPETSGSDCAGVCPFRLVCYRVGSVDGNSRWIP